ncbi:MAG TPA: M20/M25/M40 family metallo-hydrolase [Pyrinomonadaceae bacterium]|nr:M20/M25/M40 family metallo-hydrolase [Pyrinomonadaceae bacterium]
MSTDAVVLRRAALLTLAALLGLFFTPQSFAQNGPTLSTRLRSWLALDAPPGWEHRATDIIMQQSRGWRRDPLGNLILHKGSGSPRRVVACALDRPGFAVTEITDEGYLRLREVGGMRLHPLWNQFHEGQRLRVLTRGAIVPAVATVKSSHLQRGRNPNAPPTTLDDMWVDVGATSRADVKQLGIEMLDPVVRESTGWAYENFVAGQLAGVRVGCAALVTAATGQVTAGETIFLLTTLRSFGHDGLEAALRSLGRVDQVTLLDQTAEAAASGVSQRKVEKPAYLPESTGLTSLTILAPRVRYAGTLVESVDLADAVALRGEVEKAAGVTQASREWVELRNSSDQAARAADQFTGTANVLKTLADIYSVSGHEHKVREAVLAQLPDWARAKAHTDAEGNLIVEAGTDQDPVMFIAHLDEVGFEVTNVADDGMVSLRARGGLFPSLWEGQPALLHFDPPVNKASLPGVFVPRDTAATKQPEAVTAWFGVDGATLKQLGVVNGLSVTAAKEATRLGPARFTARGLDDRAGSTALVLAARRIDPATLKRKVILAWSVREETGLEGAMAMAKHYGTSVPRVFSVDTLVSSDSPIETSRFAHAPLGQGAVIRGLDNSSVAPPAELDRILEIAKAQNIPLQVGATNGGTDGSDFIRYGALHVGLSWPGRYSHSPVEVLDLADLRALERLVHALATAPCPCE